MCFPVTYTIAVCIYLFPAEDQDAAFDSERHNYEFSEESLQEGNIHDKEKTARDI